MDKNELLMAKREEILQIAARYGAHNVRVFGSVARGEAGPESDIDFLVDMEPGRSLFDLGGLLMVTLVGAAVAAAVGTGVAAGWQAAMAMDSTTMIMKILNKLDRMLLSFF